MRLCECVVQGRTQKGEGDFKRPSYSDGLVEVVGFTSGYHAGAVMFKATSCVRMAQARGARMRITGLRPDKDSKLASIFMQVDGEPWRQDVPCEGGQCLEVRLRWGRGCCAARCLAAS